MGKPLETENKQVEAQIFSDSSSVPPPPYSNMGGSQVFEVHYGDWRSDIYIVDNSGSEVFAAHREKYSQGVEIVDQNKNVIGTSRASSITTKIKFEIRNAAGTTSTFDLHNHATVGSPKYNSPAFGGQQMTWKNKFLSRKILYDLIDDSGKVYAKFESNSKTQVGKLELTDDCAAEDRLTEIAVCFLSILVRKLRNINDIPQYGIVS